MSTFFKAVKAANIAVVIIQLNVLGFQIYRWNEIVGSLFSILVSLIGFAPINTEEKWFLLIYSILIVIDFVFQLVNMIILISFRWTVTQFCARLNYAVELPAGVSCNEWMHFGYGEINHQDRTFIVTILLAAIVLIRLVQVALTVGASRKRTTKSIFFINRSKPKTVAPLISTQGGPVQSKEPTNDGDLQPKMTNNHPATPSATTSQGPKVQPLPYQQRYPRPHSVTTVT